MSDRQRIAITATCMRCGAGKGAFLEPGDLPPGARNDPRGPDALLAAQRPSNWPNA
jgi:hypothetical protein